MPSLPVTLRALTTRTGLRRALFAYALYALVEFSTWLAIILFAYDRGGASLAGVAAVLQLLPAAVLAPPLAAIGDRLPRGKALALAHGAVAVTSLLTSLALAVEAPVAVIIAASAALTTAVAVVRPIHFAALPALAVGADQLVSANSLSSLADGAGLFLGPALAGFGVAFAGPWLVLAGATIVAAIATVCCLGLRLAAGADVADGEPEGWRAGGQGLRALRGDWGSLALLLVITTSFVLSGGLDVLGVAFAVSVLDRGESAAGLVVGAVGIGGLIGALAAASVSRRRRLAPVVVAVGLLQGLCFAAVSTLGQLVPAMGVIALVGAGAALLMVSGRTLLQRCIDDRVLARVFAVQEGASLLGLAIGAGLAPLLIDWLSPAEAFVPLGLGAALLTLTGAGLIRRLDVRAVFLPHEVALLRGVPFLSVLPAYELERLAQRAEWVTVSAGTDAVRQGDAGEHFFVIGTGEFSVSVDGSLRPSALRRGDGFGETALLASIPRTATVTASSAGRLLAVSGADFLAAVTGSPDGYVLAAEVSAAHLARDAAMTPGRGFSGAGEKT
jgi:MFS family permease